MDDYTWKLTEELINCKVKLAKLENQIDILRQQVENEYRDDIIRSIKYGKKEDLVNIGGEMSLNNISAIFGFKVPEDVAEMAIEENTKRQNHDSNG